jgi:hypothetical protein
MGSLSRRRPSASLLIAIAALLVAVSGTAIAAGKLVGGDKLVAKNSLSGNRLRKHTITGLQVNLAKLGKVPRAAAADHAATATNAISAANATNATNAATATIAVNAQNASALAGRPPSAFESSSQVIHTGLVTTNAGNTVTVASFPPFTMTLVCSSSGTIRSDIEVSSSEAGSLAAQTLLPTPGLPVRVIGDSAPIGTLRDNDSNVFEFLAPSGKSYQGLLAFGENFAGHDCFANALIGQS